MEYKRIGWIPWVEVGDRTGQGVMEREFHLLLGNRREEHKRRRFREHLRQDL
jgi:hypothetical protein